MDYTVYTVDENAESCPQHTTTNTAKAEKYADELAKDYPEINVFITYPGGYLNRDGHGPTGKAW